MSRVSRQVPRDWQDLFKSTGSKRWFNRTRLPTANAIYPKSLKQKPTASDFWYSMDSEMLRYSEELGDRLSREFPIDVRSDGFAGGSGVPGAFHSLRSVSGYGMDPLPLPLMNNAAFISSLGLRSSIAPGDVDFLNELIKLFFEAAKPADLHIRKAASTGFPYFTNNNEYKKLAALKALRSPDDFLRCMTGSGADLKEGLADYHALIVCSIQERQQPTAVRLEGQTFSAKERVGPSERQAREGSVSELDFADLSVHTLDEMQHVVPGHFAMRRRTVFGYGGVPNYFMTAVMGCFRAVYLSRFEFTYKVRDRKDKERRIDRYAYTVGSDVKNMDTTVPQWFIDHLLGRLSLYWDERLVELTRRMLFASYVVPLPWRTEREYNGCFGPHPLSGSFDTHVGLPSGVYINPDLGKLWMTFVYLILFRDAGAIRSPGEIASFLEGRNPDHALLDMSDDAAMLTNSLIVRDHLMTAKSQYAVLEPETPVIYLGDVFSVSGGKKRAFPNPITFVVNEVCREDSIHRKPMADYATGVLARHQTYSHSPIFREMSAIRDELMHKHLGINLTTIARSLARHGTPMSEVDALVRAEPGVLHFKVDPADVSPETLDETVATIPFSDFWSYIKPLLKGAIDV